MPKILFIMFFLNFNFLMTVPHILFVEAILGSFEFIFLNCQFFFINVLKGSLASLKDAG